VAIPHHKNCIETPRTASSCETSTTCQLSIMLSQSTLQAVCNSNIRPVDFDGRFQNIDKRVLVSDKRAFFALECLLARIPFLLDALYFLSRFLVLGVLVFLCDALFILKHRSCWTLCAGMHAWISSDSYTVHIYIFGYLVWYTSYIHNRAHFVAQIVLLFGTSC